MLRNVRVGAVVFVGCASVTLGGALGGGCRQIIGLEPATLWDGGFGGGSAASSVNSASASSSGSATSSSSGTGGTPGVNGAPCAMNGQCESGACVDNGQGGKICCAAACAGNFACGAAGTCQTACLDDAGSGAGCVTGSTCSGGACLLGNGQACSMASECASTYCADGVCCNIACNNAACYACSAKLTGGTDGTCAPVTDGTLDPHGMCGPSAVKACGYNGKCFASTCEVWPIGTVCDSNDCNGSVTLEHCSSTGQCNQPMGSVHCPASCTSLGGHTTGACACSTASDCPAPLPNCVIVTSPPCSPSCMTGEQCCNGGCSAASSPCHDGYCAP